MEKTYVLHSQIPNYYHTMKYLYHYLFLTTSLILLGSCTKDTLPGTDTTTPPSLETDTGAEAFEGWIRVKFKSGNDEIAPVVTKSGALSTGLASVDNAALALGARQMKRVFPPAGRFEERTRKEGLHLWYDLYFDESIPVSKADSAIRQLPEVAVAEPIYKASLIHPSAPVEVSETTTISRASQNAPYNDPLLSNQWHYDNDGTLPDALAGADINLFRAWEITQGSPEVIVAVVDGGVDYAHEDLQGNVVNPAELNGQPGIDDDGNGYIDDFYGWNFIEDNNQIEVDNHGTHVAGTIAAENNNGIGVCGVAGGHGNHTGTRIISCQIFGTRNGQEVSGNSAPAIKYAADAGAVICQNSWGYTNATSMPRSDQEAIEYFIKYAGTDENGNQTGPMKGGIVIFAAGNEDLDYKTYPACYENVLSVAAIAPDFTKSWYSNYADWVDIAAPGGTYTSGGKYATECAVYSTITNNKYGYLQGTSMACPHVSGIAALIVSKFAAPGFTPDQVWAHLTKRTRAIGLYNPSYLNKLGSGLADAYMALAEDQGIAPEKVPRLECSRTAGAMAVTWPVSADEDDGTADHYLLYWNTVPLENFDPDNPPAGTQSASVPGTRNLQPGESMSHTLTGIAGETRYYVAIIASDAWGNRSAATTTSVVTPVNEPPVITRESGDGIIAVGYNQTRSVTFRLSDPEGYGCTYTLDDPSGSSTSKEENGRVRITITNYKRPPGTYTMRLTATDLGGAVTTLDIPLTLEANQPPQLTAPLENVYFSSLQEVQTLYFSSNFSDERGAAAITYTLDYDDQALYITPQNRGFKIAPLRYGPAEVTVTARDEEGLTSTASFQVMSRDYTREVDLYPNPVQDKLSIRMGKEVSGEIRIRAVAPSGQIVWDGQAAISPFAPASVDLSALSGGSYTLWIEYQGSKISRNIIKL